MRIFRIFFLVLLLAFGGQAFAQDEATAEPTPEVLDDNSQEAQLRDPLLLQDNSLITGKPCAAPCWRRITPGQTRWQAALSIVENDTTLTNVNVSRDDQSDTEMITWAQIGSETGCCQLFTMDGEIVSLIFLRIAPVITLREIIEVHGEPSYIVGTPFSDEQAIMNVIYPQKSLVIYVFVAGEQGELMESSEIIGVLYMTPPDMDFLIQTSYLQRWEGYKSYLAYLASSFEVTPSITPTPTPAETEA
jgi:hypothetical protein